MAAVSARGLLLALLYGDPDLAVVRAGRRSERIMAFEAGYLGALALLDSSLTSQPPVRHQSLVVMREICG